MLPFEFVIPGPPVSQQTRRRARRRAWVEQLRAAILSGWPADEPVVTGAIHVEITYIFAGSSGDLDNLAKPVLDALKGLVYADDQQVTDITMRKRGLAGNLRIEVRSPALVDALSRGGPFLHVLVEEAPDQRALV